MKNKLLKPLLVAGLVVQVLGIWALDYYSGYELRTGVFYAFAAAYAAWHLGLLPAVGTSVVCAVLGYVAEKAAGEVYSEAWIGYANAGSRLAFLLFVTLSISYFRRTIELARQQARAFRGPLPLCTQCARIGDADGQWCDFQTGPAPIKWTQDRAVIEG